VTQVLPDTPVPEGEIPPVRLTGADAVRLHLTLALGLSVCVGAFIFELVRALDGHTFSWMYVFEWPLFGGFAIYMWWNLFNGRDRRRPTTTHPPEGLGADPAPVDGDLVAWNRYLATMESAETEARPAGDVRS
jgi:hypothetical protein